jgi:hypothetical protein
VDSMHWGLKNLVASIFDSSSTHEPSLK